MTIQNCIDEANKIYLLFTQCLDEYTNVEGIVPKITRVDNDVGSASSLITNEILLDINKPYLSGDIDKFISANIDDNNEIITNTTNISVTITSTLSPSSSLTYKNLVYYHYKLNNSDNLSNIFDDFDDRLLPSYKTYAITLLKYYYHSILLIIYYNILITPTNTIESTKNTNLYTSLNSHISNLISAEISSTDLSESTGKYDEAEQKLKFNNNKFIENKQQFKKREKEIQDNLKQINTQYILILCTIVLTLLIICLAIYFKDNVNYLVFLFIILIIINFTFSNFVMIVESFNDDANCNLGSGDNLLKQLYKAICGLHNRYKYLNLALIYYTSQKLNRENNQYNKLKLQSHIALLNNSDHINNNVLTFHQRKAYTNLFLRLVTLLISILILLNIFGDNVIIKMFGALFFCLIFMVYLYTIKVINRTDSNTKYWNHKYGYNNSSIHGFI